MVWQVLEMLRAGMSEKEIMKAFPTRLTRNQIRAALEYAASLTRGEDYVLIKIETPTR